MIIFFRRAVQDILRNKILNVITVITIALSIIIIGSFAIFIINTNDILDSWKQCARIMVYLRPDISKNEIPGIKQKIIGIYGVKSARFIAKDEALSLLRNKMKRQAAILDNLRKNPLPDAFEIEMTPSCTDKRKIESLVTRIESLPFVDDLEYGRKWIGQFADIMRLFRLAGFAVGGLFFIASVFIVANTMRLVLYSRREEVEIMRLVGATERFIKIPFFIEGIIQGVLGGITGVVVLYIVFIFISSNLSQGIFTGFLSLRFFHFKVLCSIILCSMFVGWLGCFLSFINFKKI